MTPFKASSFSWYPSGSTGARSHVGIFRALVVVAFMLPPMASAYPQDTDPVIARANGVEVRQSDLTLAERDLGPRFPAANPAEKREKLITYSTDLILAEKLADAKGLADTPKFKRQMEFLRRKELMQTLLDDAANAALTDEAMHKAYDDLSKIMSSQQEVHTRQILFKPSKPDNESASTQAYERAKLARERLMKGEDFEALARELTDDPAGKETGGDLGYQSRTMMAPEYAEAAYNLNVGQISEPVKDKLGWHIIKLEDQRNLPKPEFDQVKEQIKTYLARKAYEEFIVKLRKDANIERLDKQTPPQDGAPAK